MSETTVTMTAKRPYLMRALYEWIVDNQLTPHVVVDAEVPNCQIPWEFVKDGQIILNISPTAVAALQITNSDVQFNARFSGKPQQVYVPIAAVVAIYARENGAGAIFEDEPVLHEEPIGEPASTESPVESSEKPKTRRKSHLKVVK